MSIRRPAASHQQPFVVKRKAVAARRTRSFFSLPSDSGNSALKVVIAVLSLLLITNRTVRVPFLLVVSLPLPLRMAEKEQEVVKQRRVAFSVDNRRGVDKERRMVVALPFPVDGWW